MICTLTLPPYGDSVKTIQPLPTIAFAAALVSAQTAVLPDGKDREQVENACTVCHTADRIMKQSMTLDQWRSELRTMVENGASLNPDEWEPVVAYLAKNFGPKVNVNTASVSELAAALDLTATEADAIVAWRVANGPYKEMKDLAKVPALDLKKLTQKESRLAF